MNLYTGIVGSSFGLANPRLSQEERQQLEQQAELYSIFVATEQLERAFVRDQIGLEEYAPLCAKLITQYKTALHFLGKDFLVEAFLAEHAVCFQCDTLTT